MHAALRSLLAHGALSSEVISRNIFPSPSCGDVGCRSRASITEGCSRGVWNVANERGVISVLFANPNALTRELTMGALNRHNYFHVVAGATTAQEVLEVVQSKDVHVALISATLADGPLSGLGVLRQIGEFAPKVKSVILFYSPERHLIVNAFRAGARGVSYLSENTSKLLRRCVEQVQAGQIWTNSSELAEVVEALS